MLFKRALVSAAAFAVAAHASLMSENSLVDRQVTCLGDTGLPCNACPDGVTVVVSTTVVIFPVVINTFFQYNTVINIGTLNIIIDNAPVTFSTTFTATTTQTVTSTV